jgi:dTDP-4-amino-4,6-dideoxygalactose transaminase
MFLSLHAAGIGKGDEVISVAHTYIPTIASIHHMGATPILIDIADDFNMDVSLLESAITEKTKAIMPVHMEGRVCSMEEIMKIAREHELLVFEDAARALGAKFNGQGSGTFGLSGSFSHYPAKLLGTAGDAGMVTTNDDEFAQKIRFLRNHCDNKATGEIVGYGFNSRLDNIHAAMLNVKLKYVPVWIKRRLEIAKMFNDELDGLGDIIIPPKPDSKYFDVYQNYVIRTKRREDLAKFLKENSIETLIQWAIPMHKQKALNLGHFKLPKTEQVSSEVISLPMHAELSDDDVNYVIQMVKKFFQ